MATLLINYADGGYFEAQKLNTKTGLLVGGLERAIQFGRQHLDAEFVARNQNVLNRRGGAGRWLWKPYIVVKALREAMAEGDALVYADSGSHFVRSIVPLIGLCAEIESKPILLFTLRPSNTNRKYTKRDCFHYMGMDVPPYPDMTHILASYFICRKTPSTLSFFEEWLRYAQDERILTEEPNTCGLPNYPEFVEHRCDQSILSLLGRKYEIAALPDISQWGNAFRPPEIPQVIEHTRWKE
jgi:hypothetical protein